MALHLLLPTVANKIGQWFDMRPQINVSAFGQERSTSVEVGACGRRFE